MTRKLLLLACIFGMTAVTLGAFGAHFLKRIFTEPELQVFETGVRYQFYHTFALLATAILGRYLSERMIGWAGGLFTAGIVCFSGSLYLLAFSEILGTQALNGILGPVTPLGGLFFIGGWLVLLLAANGYKKSSSHRKSSSS